jgi:hypothetical protein
MMDLASIAGTIESLRTIGNVAKSLTDIRDGAVLKEKVLELQSAILAAQGSAITAQSEHLQMLQTVRELEARIRELEGWEQEKLRYELKELENKRGFVYELKTEAVPSEPAHKLCVNCFNRGEKSILQPEIKMVGRAHTLTCHNCGAAIYTSGMYHSEHGAPHIKPRNRR